MRRCILADGWFDFFERYFLIIFRRDGIRMRAEINFCF